MIWACHAIGFGSGQAKHDSCHQRRYCTFPFPEMTIFVGCGAVVCALSLIATALLRGGIETLTPALAAVLRPLDAAAATTGFRRVVAMSITDFPTS